MQNVEIRVKGRIDEHWSDWFEGLMITHTDEDETILSGTVVDQAALYGIPHREARARVDRELQRAGLTDRRRSLVKTLSHGLARRADLARAMLHRPRLLILDEPTVGLDPIQVREIRALIADLTSAEQAEGAHTVVLSTHILAEVEVICRRVILIHAGRKVLDSPLEELIQGGQRLEDIFARATTTDEAAALPGEEG